MATGNWQLEHLERAFADAALDPSGWNEAMNTVASVTGATGALLLPITGAQIPEVPCSDRTAEANEAYFRDRWYEQDERHKGIPLLIKNGLFDDLDVFNERYISRHPYYQDFLTPFGFRWFAGVRVAFGEDVWCLSIQRTIEQGPFSGSQKQKLLRLSQTLSASAALAKAVGFAAAGATLDALEASGSAALLIDRQGAVFQMNRSAELMLQREVRVVNRRLVAQDARSTAAFDRALHDLIWRRSDAALSPPVVLTRAGQYPLLAYLVKPSAWAANALADCRAVVILVEVGAKLRVPEKTLRSVFNLTGKRSCPRRHRQRAGPDQGNRSQSFEIHFFQDQHASTRRARVVAQPTRDRAKVISSIDLKGRRPCALRLLQSERRTTAALAEGVHRSIAGR